MAGAVLGPAGTATAGSPHIPTAMPFAASAQQHGCYDGSCVVDLDAGDELTIHPRLGFARLLVEAVRFGEVDLVVDGSGPPLDLEGRAGDSPRVCLGKNCSQSARLTVGVLQPARVNDIRIGLVPRPDGRATLVLSR